MTKHELTLDQFLEAEWRLKDKERRKKRKELNTPWPKKEPVEFDVITDEGKKDELV